ncbi:cold shock domain-containing protein [Pseudoalteromonas sp. GABNS16G]|uniref:cold-shock protein n=1 Tax=Pseudoalteromonas sp. GABNS16G TaxID=3025324 RepID=UPI002358C152|nr:cold shock domain-containing protein [Pseudoalteromonas sp. GABNS16G]MDC9603035.1 cold shock domain-containing protein [Pseudoalteromonas sp. GABNS16G]
MSDNTRMKGTIKTWLSGKGYGFAIGEDGNDYLVHRSECQGAEEVAMMTDDTVIEFEPAATPKGYKATKVQICTDGAKASTDRYALPDSFIVTKGTGVLGYETIEIANWEIASTRHDSWGDAKRELAEKAQSIGANGVVGVTDHMQRRLLYGHSPIERSRFVTGRPAIFARRHPKGAYHREGLEGLNDAITSWAQDKANHAAVSRDRSNKSAKRWLMIAIGGALTYVALTASVMGAVFASICLAGYAYRTRKSKQPGTPQSAPGFHSSWLYPVSGPVMAENPYGGGIDENSIKESS